MSTEPRLSATAAARLAGVAYLRMLDFCRSGEIAAEQRGPDWYVDSDALDRWIVDRRMPVGALGRTTPGKPRRTNVDLLHEVMGLPGWDADRLTGQLKVTAEKLARWELSGVPNYYVPRLRALLGEING